MKEDLFTFSIQQAETLGIECAIVLAAAKTIKTELASPGEITASLKEKIPFLEEQEILKNIKNDYIILRNIFTIFNILLYFIFKITNTII